MSLTSKWWLTSSGEFDLAGQEHVDFAIAAMLNMDRTYAPHTWNSKGIPDDELAAALARGAAPEAVEFLSKRGNDARLFVLKNLGWIRTAKNVFNLWEANAQADNIIHSSKGFWRSQYSMNQYDMIDVLEFKSGDKYQVNAKALKDGGSLQVLKQLAMGRTGAEDIEKTAVPQYSTLKYGEIERGRLAGRTGDNPR